MLPRSIEVHAEGAKPMEDPRNHPLEETEGMPMFPGLLRGDSLFQSMDSQLPMYNANSVFSNISPDEFEGALFHNGGLALSRQASLALRPHILYREERVPNDKKEEKKS